MRLGVGGPDRLADLAVGADGHGGFGDDHGITGQGGANLGCGLHDIGQVGMTIAAPRWSADRDEDRLGAGHGLGQIEGKGQTACCHVLGHQVFQTRLEDRHFASLKPGDLVGVLVDADDLMTKIGKANARNKAHIARADHRNFHYNARFRSVPAPLTAHCLESKDQGVKCERATLRPPFP